MALADALSGFMGAARRANSLLIPRMVILRLVSTAHHALGRSEAKVGPLRSKAVWTTACRSHNGEEFLDGA
jgi:hypothetical protein